MPTKLDVKNPSISIGGTEMACNGNGIDVTFTPNPARDTWCEKGVDARLVNAMFQSFGPDGTETILRPLVNTEVEIIFNPGGEGEPASVDNQIIKGTAIVPPFDFVSAKPGDNTEGVTNLQITFAFLEGSVEKTIDDALWTAMA